ncbi:TetR/AcrR family transcriptional regulator [Pseudonocardia sichuanensis]|uniref:TetR family transcriptional regulator n=1 Tax=Pseudonocardia kunmingensis TaxID=630975 RepID=A0A543DJE9_9PSEU|nr:TetR/AcrR family transcriptional regulator [Pseudonocardia kunmingensis]TQM09449.1 TetR family transcriptional regulator [Pseudonocardia kunmingensis]
MNDRSPAAALIADTGRRNEAAILNAALAAFGDKGFNGASMRDVARGAGTSLSNLYNYFPSKSGLLAEVLRRANDELYARVRRAVADAGDAAGPRLRDAVRAYVGFVVDHQVAAVVAISEVRYLTGSDRERLVAARDSTEAVFAEIVAQGADDGEFRTPYPADAARSIVSLCSSVSTWYRPGGRLSRGQLAELHARYALALVEAPLAGTA